MRRDTETGRVRLSLRVDFTLHPATGAAACAAVPRSSRTSRHDGAATGGNIPLDAGRFYRSRWSSRLTHRSVDRRSSGPQPRGATAPRARCCSSDRRDALLKERRRQGR